MIVVEPYADIREAVEKRRKELKGIQGEVGKNGIHSDIREAIRKRREDIEGILERPINETVQETSKISRNAPQTEARPEMVAWQGAWLLIFTFFLAVTLVVTGLSLLFGRSSTFNAYWFMWGTLALLVIIYPIARFIERQISRC